MSSYQNAVSDKLTLINTSAASKLCITSKLGQLKYYVPDIASLNKHDLKSLLSTSIFSQSTVVHCNVPFVLCPSEVDEEQRRDYFQLSHGAAQDIASEKLSDQVDVVYENSIDALEVIPLLVNPLFVSDVKIFHDYKAGLSRSNAVYFNIVEDKMLIRVYSAAHLLLINRFDTASTDDIFYFVMFAVEQLKLDLSSIHFEFIGADKDYAQLKQLFKNYLPMLLHLPLLEMNTSALNNADDFERDWLAKVVLQCV